MIKMPAMFPANQDRYQIEYEIRHSYQTIIIGAPMKLCVIMIKDQLNSSGGSGSNVASSQGPSSNSHSSGAQIENSRFSSIKFGD